MSFHFALLALVKSTAIPSLHSLTTSPSSQAPSTTATHTPFPSDLFKTPPALHSSSTGSTSFYSCASSLIVSCLRGNLLLWVKQQDEIDHWQVHTITGRFLASLQGCAGSHCRSFSGMAVERKEAWKGGGKIMSTQAFDHGIWLADFIIEVLKASRTLYWGFKTIIEAIFITQIFFPILSLHLKYHRITYNLIFCEASPSSHLKHTFQTPQSAS